MLRLSFLFSLLFQVDPIIQAVASEGGTNDAKRRGDAFARAFSAHLARFITSLAQILKLNLEFAQNHISLQVVRFVYKIQLCAIDWWRSLLHMGSWGWPIFWN